MVSSSYPNSIILCADANGGGKSVGSELRGYSDPPRCTFRPDSSTRPTMLMRYIGRERGSEDCAARYGD